MTPPGAGPAAGRGPAAAAGRVTVDLAERSYDVHIGPGVRHTLPEVVAGLGAQRAVVVSARPAPWIPDPGVPHRVVALRDGERHKTLAAVEELCRGFAGAGLNRGDVVVSCGGGTTTDVVGLAAALYHRGVPVVHLPTSLLAQVDASTGGKTAVNLPEGKNLVGAYWQPAAVLCDTDYLETLPEREWRNGYGEIARCHFIGAGDLRGLPTAQQILASVRRKAEVVSADERDSGLRHLLNYGHTLGHALELETDFASAARRGGGGRHGLRGPARRRPGPDRPRPGGRAPGGGAALRAAVAPAGGCRRGRADRADAPGQEGDRGPGVRPRRSGRRRVGARGTGARGEGVPGGHAARVSAHGGGVGAGGASPAPAPPLSSPGRAAHPPCRPPRVPAPGQSATRWSSARAASR